MKNYKFLDLRQAAREEAKNLVNNKRSGIEIKRLEHGEIIIDTDKGLIEIFAGTVYIRMDIKRNERLYKNRVLPVGKLKIAGEPLKNPDEILNRKNCIKNWMLEETEIVETCAGKYKIPRKYIALLLDRSNRSLNNKARQMGIFDRPSKYDKRKPKK